MTTPHSLWRKRAVALLLLASGLAGAQSPDRPNIVMIMGDDIGYWNVSAYSLGMMMRTPNIDRIGKEGITFTDHYAEPSCTAGRAAFITGQMPIRTGLTKVGLPGTPEGMKIEDPTIATLLKAQGYVTGQFGKNMNTEEGKAAARAVAIDLMGSLHAAVGDLNRVKRIVKLMSLVNSTGDFTEQHLVTNGASELFGQVFGEAGAHARSAFGVAQIPLGACVEIELIAELA